MVKVVCFDVGGVLIRITRNWCEAATLAGISIQSDFSHEILLWDAPFFVDYEGGKIDDGEYVRELAEFMGGISAEAATEVHNHIMVEPLPYVDQIVDKLNELGYITACLSNTNEPHWRDMSESGRFPVMNRLQVKLASHRIGAPKPAPRAFEALEGEVGANGAEIVFFDDSEANVKAALARGWRAYFVDHSRPAHDQILQRLSSVGIELSLSMNDPFALKSETQDS